MPMYMFHATIFDKFLILRGTQMWVQIENNGRVNNWSTLSVLWHFGGVEERVRALGWDREELTSFNYSHKSTQNQHKVVSA
jgi:hypothetical protein